MQSETHPTADNRTSGCGLTVHGCWTWLPSASSPVNQTERGLSRPMGFPAPALRM